MMGQLWVGFDGDESSFDALAREMPGVEVRRSHDGTFLSASDLTLSSDHRSWRSDLAPFVEQANRVLVLCDDNITPIRFAGSLYFEREGGVDTYFLPGSAPVEIIGRPVSLVGTGSTGGQTRRALFERAAELCAREPLFGRATDILAAAGEDLRELYRCAEAIEIAHGRFPPKSRATARAGFCRRIEVSEIDWEALHRSARPVRHAVAHDLAGPTLTPRQVRALLHHALKLWLEREVPAHLGWAGGDAAGDPCGIDAPPLRFWGIRPRGAPC